ncbi:MAG: protoporphyrinogen oxidase [Myxococcota bacterium]|nr:protoporphyrinogen oxidase [Myxococcota bacterium]MDW8363831.1 protoporphyrinogen oxidase [Myxococcales bacterium]
MNGPRIVVVGAGIAGLVAARRLLQRRPDVRLAVLEAQSRPGGLVHTERTSDGFLVEHGPDAFVTDRPAALDLVRDLGIAERLIGTLPARHGAFVLHRGHLVPIPQGFALVAPVRLGPWLRTPLLSWSGKLRAGLDLILPRGPQCDDESLASFVGRRLGEEVLERLAGPLLGGIYGVDPERLSVAATVPRLREAERRHRSVILGLRRTARGDPSQPQTSGVRYGLFASFDRGLGVLVDALCGAIGGALRLGCPVRGLRRGDDGAAWLVSTDGEALEADAVLLAVPAPAASGLLAPHAPQLADALDALEHGGSVLVQLGYRREQVAHPLDGYGYLVPRAERRAVSAVTWSSSKWAGRAPPGHVLLRVFPAPHAASEPRELDDDALLALARAELADTLGVRSEPVLARVVRHNATLPRPIVGHLGRLERIDALVAELPTIELAGAWRVGVGIPDAVRSGFLAADRLLDKLRASVPDPH